MDEEGKGIPAEGEIRGVPVRNEVSAVPVSEEKNAAPVHGEEKVIHFTEEVKVILMGIIILAVIALFLMMLSFAPLLSGAGQDATLQKSTSSASSAPDLSDLPDETQAVPAPTVTPVIISGTPAPAAAPVQNRVISYVTIAPRPTDDNGPLHDLHTEISKPSYDNYFTIYSLTDQYVGTNFPYITYELKKPPLVLDFDVTLTNITDVKYYEYKIKSNKYEVTKTNIRPYENAYFTVTVRDRGTGEVITEDGVGKLYGLQNPKRIVIHKAGDYLFEFQGLADTVSLSIQVPREGNIN